MIVSKKTLGVVRLGLLCLVDQELRFKATETYKKELLNPIDRKFDV